MELQPKPIWLLDIDGVINSTLRRFPTKTWPEGQWLSKHVWSGRSRWPIHVAVPVRDYVRTVHEMGLVEIRWHTTWQETANNVSRVFDMPEFPVQPAPEFLEDLTDWWKAPPAVRVLLENRPLLWTDDDLNYLSKEEWALFRGAGAVLIRPDTGTGLSPANLQQIDQFLTNGQLLATEPPLTTPQGRGNV